MAKQKDFQIIAGIDEFALRVTLKNATDDFFHLVESRHPKYKNSRHTKYFDVIITVHPLMPRQKPSFVEKAQALHVSLQDNIKGVIHMDKRRADFTIRPSKNGITPILGVLHFLSLLERGGFRLHASSIVYRGGAYVFIGRQGVGKSTIAGLSGQRKLSDDSTIVIRKNQQYYVVANPFDPNIYVDAIGSYPLRKCLWVKHDSNQCDRLQYMDKGVTAKRLFGHLRPNMEFVAKSPTYLFLLTVAVKSFTQQFTQHFELEFSKSKKFLSLI